QLLLALGSLLVLAFLPLFFAVASLTRASLSQVRAASASSLGRAVAGHVTARAAQGGDDLSPLLDAPIGPDGVAPLGRYDRQGALVLERGEEGAAAVLPRAVAPGAERIASIPTSRGAALLVVVPGDGASLVPCAVVVRTDLGTTPSTALVRLF